jgi:uncharacterized protein YbcV (DUF1398 family)
MNDTAATAIDNLKSAQQRAAEIRPKVGGFPVLAETLRRAGVRRNIWHLPAVQTLFYTDLGPVICQGAPLTTGWVGVPAFDRESVVKAIRVDQAGESTFQEFLQSAWNAGVVRYEVDFDARNVTYFGCDGSSYVEAYPAVSI